MKKIKFHYNTHSKNFKKNEEDVTDMLSFTMDDMNDVFQTVNLPVPTKVDIEQLNYYNLSEAKDVIEYLDSVADSMNVNSAFVQSCSNVFQDNLFLDVEYMLQCGLVEYFKVGIDHTYSYNDDVTATLLTDSSTGASIISMKLVGIDKEIDFNPERFRDITRSIIGEENYSILETKESFGIEIFANPKLSTEKRHSEGYGLLYNLVYGILDWSELEGLNDATLEKFKEVVINFDYEILKEKIIESVSIEVGIEEEDLRSSFIFLDLDHFDSLMNRGPELKNFTPSILGRSENIGGNYPSYDIEEALMELEVDSYVDKIRQFTLPIPFPIWLEREGNKYNNLHINGLYIGGTPPIGSGEDAYFIIEDFRVRSK